MKNNNTATLTKIPCRAQWLEKVKRTIPGNSLLSGFDNRANTIDNAVVNVLRESTASATMADCIFAFFHISVKQTYICKKILDAFLARC
jgi:hypothetical protein